MMEFVPLATSGKSIQIFSMVGKKMNVLDVGGKDGMRARYEFYPGSDVTVADLNFGWDVMLYGLPEGNWDVILANHFIEHIPDPDYFLDECKRVMRPHTILDIGTPNLAAWFNRILFLAGYVPHSVELSKRHNVGKAFDWNDEGLGGHLYVFTVPALIQLLQKHGFKIVSVRGEASTYPTSGVVGWIDKGLTLLSPAFASAFRIKCTL